jgi:hypothetical protein
MEVLTGPAEGTRILKHVAACPGSSLPPPPERDTPHSPPSLSAVVRLDEFPTTCKKTITSSMLNLPALCHFFHASFIHVKLK